MTRTPRTSIWCCRALIAFASMLWLVSPSPAVTLDEFADKVERARKLASTIEAGLQDDQIDHSLVRTFIDQVKREFPVTENVETGEGSVEVSHAAMLTRLQAFEAEKDFQKRLPMITEIREYLSTIAFKLSSRASSAQDLSKDEEKRKLAEILRREEYQKPEAAQQSIFQRWLTEFLEWLDSWFPKSSGPSTSYSGIPALASVLRILLFAVLLALVVFLVYKIAPLIFPNLKRVARPKKKKERVILGEKLSDDATALGLFGEAEQLARSGDLRGAIRKGYIALLCDLSDRKVIGLARNKTNRDYLRDTASRRELHSRLRSVTDTFERHWYGHKRSGVEDWTRFREEYDQAIRSVS